MKIILILFSLLVLAVCQSSSQAGVLAVSGSNGCKAMLGNDGCKALLYPPLPRQSEFDVNLVSSDWRIAGAGVWAYGHTSQTYPSPYWVGWNTYTPPGGNPGEVIAQEYYYDAGHTFYMIADYTGDSQWTTIARKAVTYYLNYIEQVDPGRFAMNPRRSGQSAQNNMPYGVYLEWQRNSDPTQKERARQVLFALAMNDSFGTGESAWNTLVDLFYAREISYNVTAKYLALLAGYNAYYGVDPWGLTDALLIGRLYLYADQAISLLQGGNGGLGSDGNPITTNHKYVRPFMMANIAQALMLHYEATGDSRVIPKLETLFNLLWTVCYRENGITMSATLPDGTTPSPTPGFVYGYNSFTYTDAQHTEIADWGDSGLGSAAISPTTWVDRGGGNWDVPKESSIWPVPELNGLVLPVYWWLYQQTGTVAYRDKADLLFDGMIRVSNLNSLHGTEVAQPYINYGKIFNQMYSRIGEYVEARK